MDEANEACDALRRRRDVIFRAVYRRRSQVASKFVERYHRDGRAVGRVCLEAGFVCMALSDKDIPYLLQSGKKHRLFSVCDSIDQRHCNKSLSVVDALPSHCA